MNIILVTRDSVLGRYIAATLHHAGKLDRVIIETGRPSWRFFWRKLRRVGPANAVFQFLLDRWFQREAKQTLPRLALPPHEEVPSINGFTFNTDDLVIGFGTSIVSAATLARTQQGFLNLHTGWLPDYRGVKSEFWTLARDDRARTGWTLHYMTPRIDEGDIVLRRSVPFVGASPAALRVALVRDAVPTLESFIDKVRREGLASIRRQPQQGGQYFTTPTWREWRSYGRRTVGSRRGPSSVSEAGPTWP